MPPTTTDPDLAELRRAQELHQAVADLFVAIAAHSAAVSVTAEGAVRSMDLKVIRSLSLVLESMTTTLQRCPEPMPRRRHRLRKIES